MNGLKKFSTDELLEELVRRRNSHEQVVQRVKHWCEDCGNFRVWSGSIEKMPENYNPCSAGHSMKFLCPPPWGDPHGLHGFYRTVCPDRRPAAPPLPPPPPPGSDNKPMEYQLLDLIGPEMSEEERAAVWTLIGYVKKQPKGTA